MGNRNGHPPQQIGHGGQGGGVGGGLGNNINIGGGGGQNAALQAQAFQVFRHVNPNRRINRGHHRVRYTAGQKENAIRLLNLGLSYRQVARMTSPHCSSGTPHRWRREHTRREEQRRRMEELRRRRRW